MTSIVAAMGSKFIDCEVCGSGRLPMDKADPGAVLTQH